GILASNLMAVLDRAREIAILKTMGSTDISITRVFVGEGLLLGTLGSLTGVFAGLAICAVLAQTGLPIDEGIFYMERLPIDVRPLEVLGVAVVAIVIVWISSLYPARLAGALAPVDVLRSSEL
ncbi:MAG: FtsX-like permease family protein, partial [Nannocystaceae bacterium]